MLLDLPVIASFDAIPPTDEDLHQSLVQRHPDALASLFHANGVPRPVVLWQPQLPDLGDPRHQEFLTICRELAGDDDLPRRNGFVETLPDHLRRKSSLVSFSAAGQLNYDYFGKDIADQFGKTIVGPMQGQIPDHVFRFYTALFRAIHDRRQVVFTEHQPPGHMFVQAWHRLSVPLTNDSGEIIAVSTVNIALNPLRVGMDVVHDPVFVLSSDQGIMYANPPARLLMPKGDGRPWGGDFFEETGIALPADLPSAADLMGQRKIETRRSLMLRENLLSAAVVSISAVMHRSWPCYVVMARPER